MPTLRVPFNFGYRVLNHNTPGRVEVYRRDGSTEIIPWLGFIDINSAYALKSKNQAVPVKIRAASVSSDEPALTFEHLPKGKFVQGCLIESGVFAVTTTQIKVI